MTDQELQQLVASNARTIQAMLEQQETSRLRHENHAICSIENIQCKKGVDK
jgi:hypothetical protein